MTYRSRYNHGSYGGDLGYKARPDVSKPSAGVAAARKARITYPARHAAAGGIDAYFGRWDALVAEINPERRRDLWPPVIAEWSRYCKGLDKATPAKGKPATKVRATLAAVPEPVAVVPPPVLVDDRAELIDALQRAIYGDGRADLGHAMQVLERAYGAQKVGAA